MPIDEHELQARFGTLADLTDDSDWSDVRRRASLMTATAAPKATGRPRATLRRWRTAAAAATAMFALGAASPAIGLGDPIGAAADEVSSLFGGEPEEHFSMHEGRRLPVYLQVGRTEQGTGSGVIAGKVFASQITLLQLRMADGSLVALALNAKREFHFDDDTARPTELIARDANGNVVTRLPTIPPTDPH